MRLRYLILIFAAFIMTGCATVNRGTVDHFRVDSVPQGAAAITSIETPSSKRARRKNPDLSPVYKGCNPTPCAIELPRHSEFVVKLEHPNYEPVEMFVTSSSRRGSLTANTAATAVTTAGTTVGGAALAAGLTTAALGATGAVTGGLVAGTGAGLTFGLVSVEAAVAAGTQTGLNAGLAAAPSTSGAIVAAVPPALAVTGGMMLVDAASGANKNFFPNPVVLKLAPVGTPVKTDPLVAIHNEKKLLRDAYKDACPLNPKKGRRHDSEKCRQLKKDINKLNDVVKQSINPKKSSTR